mmetsp:Transcript_30837/g.54111  ORF Transcript_30837/g.54111 Transcript_30837/m.54111 type:complete len:210 (-) Transcript_30837:468-1097(-)
MPMCGGGMPGMPGMPLGGIPGGIPGGICGGPGGGPRMCCGGRPPIGGGPPIGGPRPPIAGGGPPNWPGGGGGRIPGIPGCIWKWGGGGGLFWKRGGPPFIIGGGGGRFICGGGGGRDIGGGLPRFGAPPKVLFIILGIWKAGLLAIDILLLTSPDCARRFAARRRSAAVPCLSVLVPSFLYANDTEMTRLQKYCSFMVSIAASAASKVS